MQPTNTVPNMQQPMPATPGPVVSEHMPAAQSVAVQQDRPGLARRAIKPALVSVAVVVAFIGGYYVNGAVVSASHKNASETAKQFIDSLNAGDNASAYALTSADLQKRESQKKFTENLGDLKAGKPTYLSQSMRFNDDGALYTLQEDGLPATSEGLTTGTFTISLVKDGMLGWKVDTVTVE